MVAVEGLRDGDGVLVAQALAAGKGEWVGREGEKGGLVGMRQLVR